MAKAMRTEPFLGRSALKLQQVTEPVANRPAVDSTTTLVAEQRVGSA
jgi:hypothetical protein